MKKSEKKKSPQSKRKQKAYNGSENLYDLGIEPPKLYRDSQKAEYSYNKKVSKRSRRTEELTRSEKRQLDNKKRKKRNTLRKIIIWFVALLVFAVVGTVLSLTVFFQIDTINVKGNEIYTKDEIIAQCPISIGENLFLSDTEEAKQKLETNLPYIYNAQITRKLPYTIEIKITEATPKYSIKQDKKYILLDDNFKVLETEAKKASGILITKAQIKTANPGNTIEFKNADTGECLKKLADVIKNNDFKEITSIYSNGTKDNYVVYENRIEFKLGSCDDLESKIYQGLAACEKLNESNPNASGIMNITGGKSLYFTEK